MNFKSGLVMAKAFECFSKDFQSEINRQTDWAYLVTPNLMRNRKTTILNGKIFKDESSR